MIPMLNFNNQETENRSILMKKYLVAILLMVICFINVGMAQEDVEFVEEGEQSLWYVAATLGMLTFEGDQDVDDTVNFSLKLGYEFSEWWSYEAAIYYAPTVDISDKGKERGATIDSTSLVSFTVEGLFHFTRWNRLDPFLVFGAGFDHYMDDLPKQDETALLLVAGAGAMYHLSDSWSIRATAKGMLAGFGSTPNANMLIEVGAAYAIGAETAKDFMAVDGPLDTDGDGLIDAYELQESMTDPLNPDSDNDGLTDGYEVHTSQTDALNPDTDFDMLKDGEEVNKYKTNPLLHDTDNGGVSDGHEVFEDKTNPLDGSDDFVLFSLNIEFDSNKAVIKQEYFNQIDVIGKVLQRHPEATAVIEGHADKRKTSSKSYNQKLSQKRAEAVKSYIENVKGIEPSRLKAVGYGFSRPIAKNDPITGNIANRRVDIYLDGIKRELIREDIEKINARPPVK
jgi:outer membrane protein OmpA-like peptidoglycan-associated protein/opacity protein-like surface antigen